MARDKGTGIIVLWEKPKWPHRASVWCVWQVRPSNLVRPEILLLVGRWKSIQLEYHESAPSVLCFQKNMITCLLCRRISCSHAVTSPTSRGTWKPLAVSACKSGFSRLNTQHMRRGIKVLEIPDKGRAGLTCDAAIPGAKRRSRCCVSWNGRFCFRTGRGRKEKKTGQMGDKQIVSKKGIIINV
jgi:hypothetical protein